MKESCLIRGADVIVNRVPWLSSRDCARVDVLVALRHLYGGKAEARMGEPVEQRHLRRRAGAENGRVYRERTSGGSAQYRCVKNSCIAEFGEQILNGKLRALHRIRIGLAIRG